MCAYIHLFPYRKYLEAINFTTPDPYQGDIRLPIFTLVPSDRKRLFSVEDTVKCLLHPQLNCQYVCQRVPITVSHNVAFLVDVTKLDDPGDIDNDNMGVWKNNGVDTCYVKVARDTKQQVKSVTKCTLQNPPTYKVKRCYRIHGTDSTLRKITTTLYGMSSIELHEIPSTT